MRSERLWSSSCRAAAPEILQGREGTRKGITTAAQDTTPGEALLELASLAEAVAASLEAQIEAAAGLVAEALASGGKVMACGNGGSAADAQHFVAEFVGRLGQARASLPAITLNVDPSILTAISNDYGFDMVFARQVEGLGSRGDVLFGLSTSGRSANVLRALATARQRGMRTVALVGESGSPELDECDIVMRVPSASAQRVQEIHMALLHGVCASAERRFLG